MSVHIRKPRAVAGFPLAQNDPVALIGQLGAAFDAFKATYDGKLESFTVNMQAAVDELNDRMAAGSVNGFGNRDTDAVPVDRAYSELYANWARGGDPETISALRAAHRDGPRREIMAAMSAGSPSDGGYLAPTEWDRRILKELKSVSPMRRLADVVATGVGAYSTLWNDGNWGSGWVGDTASRPQTNTPTLQTLEFAGGELYANPAITQRLLDDADFPIQEWLAKEVSGEFAKQEGSAFLSGDGVNKPRGLLTYVTGGANATTHPGGSLTVVPSGAAAGLSADGLVDFFYSLTAEYRQNASWLMSSSTAAVLTKLKDGDGNYLWRESYVAGQPSTLLGKLVEIDEGMPAVAAGNLAIAFGDFKTGYVINDRFGVRVLRDPYTAKPYVLFYTTKRVGGGVRDPRAIRLMKIGTS